MEMFTRRSSSLELLDIIDILSRDQVEILKAFLPVCSVRHVWNNAINMKIKHVKFELNISLYLFSYGTFKFSFFFLRIYTIYYTIM